MTFEHKDLQPIVQTPSLVLRHLGISDTKAIFKFSQETGIKTWIPDQVYEDEQEAHEVLHFLIAQYQEPSTPAKSPYVLAVCLRSTGALIGHVGFSPYDREAEIGYAIADAYQGLGYAKQAVTAASAWALSAFNLGSVIGMVAEENIASRRVLEASGYKEISSELRGHHGAKRVVTMYRYPV